MKELILVLLLWVCLSVGISSCTKSYVDSHGGIKGILIEAGKEIKDIQKQIDAN